MTSTTSDARNQPVTRTTISSDGSSLGGTTVYNPDADYQPDAIYTPIRTSGGTIVELQTTYTYETTGAVRRARLIGQSTRACVTPSANHLTCNGGSTALGSSSYEYDSNDNVIQVTEDNGSGPATHYYCHDGRNQLVTRRAGPGCGTALADETYVYDPAGNIKSASGGGLQTTYSYVEAPEPAAPVLMTAQAVSQTLTVTTDSAGLTTSVASSLGTTWSYRYDTENRMVSACRAASCSGTGFDRVDYGFDGAGHRTRITTTTALGVVTVLDIAYTGDLPAQDRVNGTVARTYVADDTGRIVRFCDPDCTGTHPVYLVSFNAHGDALSIGHVDPSTGVVTVANRFRYETWGTPTTTTVNGYPDLGFRYLWVGAADVAWDNSAGQALYDMHARTYHPALGRFLQPDPARADGNLYAYAGNSPVTKSDPTGEFAIVFVFVAWGAILILGAAATYHPTTSYGSHPLRAPSGSLKLPFCIGSCGRPTGYVLRSAPPGTRLVSNTCAMSLRGCTGWLLSNEKKVLDGKRAARKELQRKLSLPGNEDAHNHWGRNLRGIEEEIKVILRRHPQLRRPGDPAP